MTPATPTPPPSNIPITIIYKPEEVLGHLDDWRKCLDEALRGEGTHSVKECRAELDKWLDELLEVRGR